MRLRILNVDVVFSFWFFAVISIFAAINAGTLAFYFALPVLLHELGHLIAMLLCGSKIDVIRFTAFGIEIEKSKASKSGLVREIIVCMAGITANLFVALGIYWLAFKSMRNMLLISANTAVAIFSLLPIGNLDGGELARILSEHFFKPRLAYLLSRIFSFICLVPLFALAIFLLFKPERNFTLLVVCCYLLADIIIKG